MSTMYLCSYKLKTNKLIIGLLKLLLFIYYDDRISVIHMYYRAQTVCGLVLSGKLLRIQSLHLHNQVIHSTKISHYKTKWFLLFYLWF